MAAQMPAWTRIYNKKIVDSIQKDTKKGLWNLDEYECWWKDHQPFLHSHGYMLRARFRPGWVPSWLGTNLSPSYCEDSYKNVHPKTIDAVRISDNATVCIKRVLRDSSEISIGRFLTTAERLQDPNNHCVPILDSFPDELNDEYHFIVMPLLRPFNDPPFITVDEVIEFIRQCLQGLVYLHSQGVAHRDLFYSNIMLDPKPLYPEGFHPISQNWIPSVLRVAKFHQRSEVSHVKYLFTDFGISTHFKNNETPRLVTGDIAQDPDVPELSLRVPYDPFAVDVFTLGNLFNLEFLNRYSNLTFLRSLTTAMTQNNPQQRPTAAIALANFTTLLEQRDSSSLRWRLRRSNETTSQRLRADFSFFMARLMKNPFFLASVVSFAAGSIVSLLYGPRAVLHRLKASIDRFRSR